MDMNDACDGNDPLILKIDNFVHITSPGYPENNYENNMNCTWKIESADGKRIELSIRGQLEEKYVFSINNNPITINLVLFTKKLYKLYFIFPTFFKATTLL